MVIFSTLCRIVFNFLMKLKKLIIVITVLVTFIFVIFYYNRKPQIYIQSKDINFTFPDILPEEFNFTLAYGISFYKDVSQVIQLLKLIYRPCNLYCIHIDIKSEEYFHILIRNLTKRYLNIIVPDRFVNVKHSQFSVIESELLCMNALLRNKAIKWKYFINLTGQELPLKTNLELVRILSQLNGTNLMEKTYVNDWRIPKSIGPPPHGIQLWKGAVHIVVIHKFVEFILHDQRSLDLLQYLRSTFVPDETYFSTLNNDHSLSAPGGYSGDLITDSTLHPFLNRHKIWIPAPCHGTYLRSICIFSMGDVPQLISPDNTKLFANKFVLGTNDDVFHFMVQWFHNRTTVVYSNPSLNPFINPRFYSQLLVVKHHFD